MLSKNNAIHETALSTAFSVVFACEFIFYASACTQETDAQSSKRRKGEAEREVKRKMKAGSHNKFKAFN